MKNIIWYTIFDINSQSDGQSLQTLQMSSTFLV